MTKYVVEILKQLGIDYHQYDIRNHSDEESGETWITLHAKSEVKSDHLSARNLTTYMKAFMVDIESSGTRRAAT